MTNLKKIAETNPNNITPEVLHDILFVLAAQVEKNTLKANFALEKVLPYKTLETHPIKNMKKPKKKATVKTTVTYHKSEQLPSLKILRKRHATEGVVVAISQDIFLQGWHIWIKPHDDLPKKTN